MTFQHTTARTATVGDYRIRDMDYGAGVTHPRHGHDEMQISIVLRGSYREHTASGSSSGSAADVVLKPAGTMHADDFEGARIVCVDGPWRDLGLGGYAWHRGDAATSAAMRLATRFAGDADIADEIDELLAALTPHPYRDHVLAARAARAFDECSCTTVGVRAVAADGQRVEQ